MIESRQVWQSKGRTICVLEATSTTVRYRDVFTGETFELPRKRFLRFFQLQELRSQTLIRLLASVQDD